jgi:hypothetical protein
MSNHSNRYTVSEESSAPYFSPFEVAILAFTDTAGIAAHVVGMIEAVVDFGDGPALFDFSFRNQWRSGDVGGTLTLSAVPAWRYVVDRAPNEAELLRVYEGQDDDTQRRMFFRSDAGHRVYVSDALGLPSKRRELPADLPATALA